jgi:hypothetical protein
MTARRQQDELELVYSGTPHELPERKEHGLGIAIFLMAINDYCSRDVGIHEDARSFLYPTTPDGRNAFHWAISLVDTVNADWLRGALNRSRDSWDVKRAERPAATTSRGKKLKLESKSYGLKTNMEHEPAAAAVRCFGDAVQQPGTADHSRIGDTTAHV